MNFIDKLRHTHDSIPQNGHNGRPTTTATARLPLHATPGSKAAAQAAANGRFSNGLKEFLWQLEDLGHGNLLDLGQVCQNTLNFFIERNFKVYTEDVLVAWRQFLDSEDERVHRQVAGAAVLDDNSKAARAERFLNANLNHAPNSFDAVLLWDVLDYLDRDMVTLLMQRLSVVARDGAAVLAIFHTRMPEQFYRYRVLDGLNLDPFEVKAVLPAQRIYQNREIQDLFSRFRTSKTFVARDQLREIIFAK